MGGNFEPSHSPTHTGWSWQSQSSWGFYLLPSRAWELLIGVLIATWQFQRTEPTSKQYRLNSEILCLSGFCLIGYAIFAFDRTTGFPSVYTLVPTLGTGLIIMFATPGTIVQRILSSRILVSLGLISCSLYLSHHPPFAFSGIYRLNEQHMGHSSA
jgi:peptidoglycan/LPS O-acetylase OafA/YrhL